MIAILRKNVSSLISNHTSLVCKSNVPFSPSINFFSTLGERNLASSGRIYDVLVHKHQFSPQVASAVAADLSRCKAPEKADSTLFFLKESGFSTTQLEKIAKFRPRILAVGSEDVIKFKIKIFQDLGLSPKDIAKVVSSNLWILSASAKNTIIPSLSLLKGLLGSHHDVATLLTRSATLLTADLEKTLVPNVEFLKSCGIGLEQICILLYRKARCLLLRPDFIRKSTEKAKQLGVSQSSGMFVLAVQVIASMSKETWELKLQAFRNLGFSDTDISTMFRKQPAAFGVSIQKISKVTELLLATGKFNISSIASNPSLFTRSIEKRYKPRLRILGILESRNLIKKWPSLGTIYSLTDDKFFKKFIGPYSNELGEEYISKSCIKGRGK